MYIAVNLLNSLIIIPTKICIYLLYLESSNAIVFSNNSFLSICIVLAFCIFIGAFLDSLLFYYTYIFI